MNPVVIDTNCLLQIIARKSPYRPIQTSTNSWIVPLLLAQTIWCQRIVISVCSMTHLSLN